VLYAYVLYLLWFHVATTAGSTSVKRKKSDSSDDGKYNDMYIAMYIC